MLFHRVVLLLLGRSLVVVGGMRSDGIVEGHVLLNLPAQLRFGREPAAIDEFRFETLEKRLHDRIVIGRSRS